MFILGCVLLFDTTKKRYASSGLSPDGSSSVFLPKLLGRRTLEFAFGGRYGAKEAEAMGLVNRGRIETILLHYRLRVLCA